MRTATLCCRYNVVNAARAGLLVRGSYAEETRHAYRVVVFAIVAVIIVGVAAVLRRRRRRGWRLLQFACGGDGAGARQVR